MFTIENLLYSIFLPLNNPRAGLRVGRLYADLQKSQWYDHRALEQLQNAKVKCLMEYARNNVPFYKDYNAWEGKTDTTFRETLATYPILKKEDIRANSLHMHTITGMPRACIVATTGGTTGKPIEVWHSRKNRALVDAATWRGRSWVGIKPWTRGVNVQSFGRGSWYGRLRVRLTNKWIMDVFGQTYAEKLQSAKELLRISPKYLEGFVSETLALGDACYASGVQIDRVLTTGEMLYQHNRDEIKRLYGAEVSVYYGCNEIGAMAFECEHGSKHITDEHVIVEVVDENGVPQWEKPGRILLTDLDNYLTPFIRYEVGDIGILTRSSCPCGRELTLLKDLEGRTQDFIINASGDKLSSLFFAGRFKDMKLIHRIQLVQRSLNEIDLLYEGSSEVAESELEEIISEIHNRLGPEMQVSIKQVGQLIYTGRGKCRLIINL